MPRPVGTLVLAPLLGVSLVLCGTASGSTHHGQRPDTGCSVHEDGYGIDGPLVWIGTDDPGAKLTCVYTAHQAAGYRGTGLWRVKVTRGKATTEYLAGVSPACSPIGTIQPGDVVLVSTKFLPVVGLQLGVSAASVSPTAHC